MTPYDSLMLETIPVRITPAPKADRGPTEQYARAESMRLLWELAAETDDDAVSA